MAAPQKFTDWVDKQALHKPKYGYVYKYHPRSDAHSIALCTFVLEALLEKCAILVEQAARSLIAYGINVRHTWPNKKRKTIDLAIGTRRKSIGRSTSFPESKGRSRSASNWMGFQPHPSGGARRTVLQQAPHRRGFPRSLLLQGRPSAR